MSQHADSYRSALLSHAHGVRQLDDTVTDTIEGLGQASKHLTHVIAANLHEPLSQTGALLTRLNDATTGLSDGVKAWNASGEAMQEAASVVTASHRDLGAALEELNGAVPAFRSVASELHRFIKDGLVDGQAAVATAVEGLNGTTGHLNHFLDGGFEGVKERLQELQAVVCDVSAALNRVKPLVTASENGQNLLAAINRSAIAVEALQSLPEKIVEELGAVREHANGDHREATRTRSWFGRVLGAR
jgi:ABC-type transporter Mla subunit MlaD